MRVLLPLKKQVDDQDQQYEESSIGGEGETYDEAAATTAVVAGVGSPASVGAEEAWGEQTASPSAAVSTATTVLLSAAAAKLSCLPATTPTTSDSDSEAESRKSFDEATTATASGTAGTAAEAESQAVAGPNSRKQQGTEEQTHSDSVAKTTKEADPRSPTNSPQPIVSKTAGSTDQGAVVEGPLAAAVKRAAGTATSVGLVPSDTSPPPVLASPPENSGEIVSAPPSTGTRGARKRRSASPPAALDCKPPSKKGRDTKPAAVGTMAGGGSRGGRKIWGNGSASYYIDTNNGGREDLSNSEDSAEVDVRVSYRQENNDPAAQPNIAGKSRRPNNNYVCGRDDVDDSRDREMSIDRPEATEDDQLFALALKKRGLEIVEQEGDGNCLFRAISLQVYGDASMHLEVRHRCLDFMARDKEHFSQFITDEPFEQYIHRKRRDGVHGNNPEIQAISELFNRPIEVFVPENGAAPLNIFHAEYKTQDAPIRLSYHDGNHYNAVIDPLVPTAGLGLGLPGLQPGLADKMQVAKAVAESDRLADQREFERALEESHNDQLQRAIKESSLSVDHMYQNKALNLSDCDATNFELEQAVLESSLESFRTFEHGRKQASKSSVSSGRRNRQASPLKRKSGSAVAVAAGQSSVASVPREARQDAGSNPIPRAAAAAAVATSVAAAPPAVASRPSNDNTHSQAAAAPLVAEQYPQSVQELVMNGFELRKVVRAFELVGDNFDDLLGFLMTNGGS